MTASRSLLLLTILLAFSAIGIGTCCASLQQAVDESVDGCIIIMRGGTWNEHVVIDNDLTIIGGYGGGETVINGAPAGYGTGDNYGISDSSVFKIDYADVVLTGLTITDGNADTFGYGIAAPVPVTTGGGGILNIGGTLTLNDVTITGNTATHGAGVYNDHGTVILNSGTTIEGNTVPGDQAAYGEYGIDDSGRGGGIYNDHGTVIMNDGSSITGNSATVGGGVYNDGGTVIMNGDSSITGNTANQNGGGICNYQGTVNMYDSSSISNNFASFNGGGIVNSAGTVTMNGESSIVGNRANQNGGGIFNMQGTVEMHDGSSISGNAANLIGTVYSGGGIWTCDGTLDLDESAVFDNTPDDIFQ